MELIPKAFAQTSIPQFVATDAGWNIANTLYWAIGIGALLALGAIIYGGLMYSTSGMPGKHEEGKEWIWGAIKGLILLLSAGLLLSTINPEILKF